jgi:hypothetical protein
VNSVLAAIIFNVDNQAVVAIINKKSSKFNRVMTLVRNLVSLCRSKFWMVEYACPQVEHTKAIVCKNVNTAIF